ncbi:hypothetical protein PVK66_00450 [Aliivibrio sp. S4MY4]|uniref:hypothetical protein n=1 Tax=unclassified Aliivibrio TaxID=2645654 RepID=UPI0023781EFB|nr:MULTISPECIES: hypothetical protein [unclassified Aliivibrio]MDD9162979.1 hypothetical protein [Aliivibrio sp. S4MY2]MDD9166660.1 hypothetical protein [Aliivibrio sp. S4MY4]MDD9184056.1 hypothetical protein [Aliivibrio sp. S4MY3]MDD9200967.1 hypothetical protein [Aliivibrio sp. S4MY1]
MSELKTAEQFYQASLEHLNKANELHEKMEATERKTVALFSRFIDGTKPVSGDVELAAKDNLKAIQQRDVLAVINSITAMALDMPKPLYMGLNIDTISLSLCVWCDSSCTHHLLNSIIFFSHDGFLENAIQLESNLAEIIINAKDNAEVTA